MTIRQHKFGSTTIAKVTNVDDWKQLLVDPWLKSETIIIKPNWVVNVPSIFTDAEDLKTLFEALDSKLVVTESHMINRSMNLLKKGMPFTVRD
jgi:hypothetical protein